MCTKPLRVDLAERFLNAFCSELFGKAQLPFLRLEESRLDIDQNYDALYVFQDRVRPIDGH
ncbi:MAG: hypothetical protein WBC26_07935 [Alphaproteobacteria bacterium]|nr:hypothetical protein [Alphaproteobacteria bacterium]MBP7763043.1 hypothetical protein [Alphaproteobacteria bacterium]